MEKLIQDNDSENWNNLKYSPIVITDKKKELLVVNIYAFIISFASKLYQYYPFTATRFPLMANHPIEPQEPNRIFDRSIGKARHPFHFRYGHFAIRHKRLQYFDCIFGTIAANFVRQLRCSPFKFLGNFRADWGNFRRFQQNRNSEGITIFDYRVRPTIRFGILEKIPHTRTQLICVCNLSEE